VEPVDDGGQAWRSGGYLAFALYLLVLLVLTFAPFGAGSEIVDRINVEPFATIRSALRHGSGSVVFRLMLGNIAAFLPLGLLLPRVAPRAARSIAVVLVLAVALSSAIEVGQLAVSQALGYAYRSTDVDDIILNVLGALIGYVLLVTLRFLSRSPASG
jgi:glycopeptide antibiotics resistance protein